MPRNPLLAMQLPTIQGNQGFEVKKALVALAIASANPVRLIDVYRDIQPPAIVMGPPPPPDLVDTILREKKPLEVFEIAATTIDTTYLVNAPAIASDIPNPRREPQRGSFRRPNLSKAARRMRTIAGRMRV